MMKNKKSSEENMRKHNAYRIVGLSSVGKLVYNWEVPADISLLAKKLNSKMVGLGNWSCGGIEIPERMIVLSDHRGNLSYIEKGFYPLIKHWMEGDKLDELIVCSDCGKTEKKRKNG